MLRTFTIVAVIAFIATIPTTTEAFGVIPQDRSNPIGRVNSPNIPWLTLHPVKYPIFGQITYVTEKHPTGDFTGKVIFYQNQNGDTKERVLKRMAHLNPVAFVFILRTHTRFPGISAYTPGDTDDLTHKFPVYEITQYQNDTLAGWFTNQTIPNYVIVAFPFVEKNPWKGVFVSTWPNLEKAHRYGYFIPIFCNLLLVYTGITLVIAIYKLTLLILEKGFQRSIAQIVLWLNIICLSLRCAYLASNPMGAYGGTSFLWVQFGATLPFSFCISGTLLITLYWHEMILRAGHQINLFLSSMMIPFLIACCVIFGIEIASVIVRGLSLLIPVVIIVDAAIYAAVVLALLIFFIVTKIRLTKEFKRLNRTLNLEKGKKLAIASNIVIGIAVVMVLWLAAMLFLAAGKYFWSPPGFAFTWIILLTSMTTLCLLQILLIRAPWRPWRWILCGIFKAKPHRLYSPRHGTFSSSFGSVSYSKSNQGSRDMGSAELGSLETGTNSSNA